MTYVVLDHTADLRVRLSAPDIRGLYDSAVELIEATLVSGDVEGRYTVQIEESGDDDAERLFRFIRELLYLYDVDGFVPTRVVSIAPMEIAGERFDPTRHAPRHQPKALTHHCFQFGLTDDGYEVELVFDL